MDYRLELTAEAHLEEEAAYNYYEDLRANLGNEFLKELDFYYSRIAENPYLFAFVGQSTILRDVKIRRFPFLIVYFVVGRTVVVLSVRNTSQRPFLTQ